MISYPDEPALPSSHRAEGSAALRYEDVAQDGRILLDALPTGLGVTVWEKLLSKHPLARVAKGLPEPDGLPKVPERPYAWRAPECLLDEPAHATPLEPEPRADAPVVFGIGHTDSNQHVNSLVYLRRFEEGVLRRLAELG